MSIETAFIVCAFGGLIIGGGVGEIAENQGKEKSPAQSRAEETSEEFNRKLSDRRSLRAGGQKSRLCF